MTSTTPSAESVFESAVAIANEADRTAYLDGRCGNAGPLREEVQRLLERHFAEEDFLKEVREADLPTDAMEAPGAAGDQIGPYTLLQQIGEGGMGVVFMAEQKQPVRRRVALKLIKSGMDSKEVLARFTAERQAMAMMDHPNIARVLDAGQTETGRPFFVMELVMGTPITTFCNERKLTPRERLELFIPVCRAVQHAHQKGVIHRDLKPSNVLVTHYDEQIVPKVIDFGLAKALHQPLTEHTVFTRFGQLVGTWEYMSPEQAKLNQLDVDTRSDVYSLGVLLYELLAGQTPFDRRSLKEAALDEVLRTIREVEPPRPSQRLRQSGVLQSTAEACSTQPDRLENILRGDLDAVIGKALEKDRGRRYDTAASFADDVKRYLADEPVIASPPTAFERVRRFVRRNRAAALTVLAFIALLAAAASGGVSLSIWALWERGQATAARSIAEENEQQALDLFYLSESLRFISSPHIAAAVPVEHLSRAIAAVERTWKQHGAPIPAALEALLSAATRIAGAPISPEGGYEHLAARKDGRVFATAASDGAVRVWDLDPNGGCDLRYTLHGRSASIEALRISRDGTWVAASSGDGVLRVWRLAGDDPQSPVARISTVAEARDGAHWALTLSPSARRLAVAAPIERAAGSRHHPVVVCSLDAQSGAVTSRRLLGHSDYVITTAFSPDERWLYTTGRDETLLVWDLRDEQRNSPVSRTDLDGYLRVVSADESNSLIGWTFYDQIEVWDVSDKLAPHFVDRFSQEQVLNSSDDDVQQIAVAAGLFDASLFEWPQPGDSAVESLGTFASRPSQGATPLVAPLRQPAENTTAPFATTPYGRQPGQPLYSMGHDGSATLIHSIDQWSVSVGENDGTLRRWDLNRELAGFSPLLLPGPGASAPTLKEIAGSPGGRFLAARSPTHGLRVWEMTERGPIESAFRIEEGRRDVRVVTFGAREDSIFTGHEDGTVCQWSTETNGAAAPEKVFHCGDAPVQNLCAAPDDAWLAAASWIEGGTESLAIHRWDLRDPTSLPTLIELDMPKASYLEFSGNANWLVAAVYYDQNVAAPVQLIDVRSGRGVTGGAGLPLHNSEYKIFISTMDAQGRWLLTGSESGEVIRFDLDAADPLEAVVRITGSEFDPVRALAMTSDCRRIYVGRWHWRGSESLLSVNPATAESESIPLSNFVYDTNNVHYQHDISPDGKWLAVGMHRALFIYGT